MNNNNKVNSIRDLTLVKENLTSTPEKYQV